MICGCADPEPAPHSGAGVCGKVWKTGDRVYHCRTCGMDPSCAICHDCFEDSDHTGHDYWMFSSGGGCCDCGDVEAWRREGFCCKHPGPHSTSLDVHACDKLPAGERRCAEAVLDSVTAAYLHIHLLVDGSEDHAQARPGALDRRLSFVHWLTRLAAASPEIRSLVGRQLTKARDAAAAPELASIHSQALGARPPPVSLTEEIAHEIADDFEFGTRSTRGTGPGTGATSADDMPGGTEGGAIAQVQREAHEVVNEPWEHEAHGGSTARLPHYALEPLTTLVGAADGFSVLDALLRTLG